MTDSGSPVGGKSSTGLDQNLAAAISYLGGVFTGVFFLVIEKDSRYVKFHAMQSTMVFVLVIALWMVSSSIPFIGVLLNVVLITGVAILWLFLMFKALNGELYKLPYVGDVADQHVK